MEVTTLGDHFKSGFVSLIGRPNVGKSTLINHLIGEKVSIVSDKIQTTRQTIHGVLTSDDMQVVFIDTPGVHKPKHQLGNYMVDVSLNTLKEVDLVLFMVNADEGYGGGDEYIIERLNMVKTPKFLIINKVDLINPDNILPLIAQYKDKCDFDEVIPVSALNGNNLEQLMALIKEKIPVGPQYYGEDQLTNRSERFFMGEIIREKILHYTKEEVPHSVNVLIDSKQKNEKGQLHIQATIITERDSQKGIIIGKRGSMLKQIGQAARLEMEEIFGEKIYLEVWVKVQKDWRNKRSLLNEYGFTEDH